MKAFAQSAEAGKVVLQLDTIPAIAALVGDSFNQVAILDSALTYFSWMKSKQSVRKHAV